MGELDSNYWQGRYLEDKIGWDIGYANPIHTSYIEQKVDKDTSILVPGAGSAYEVEHIWRQGYTNVYACDFAPEVKERFLKRVPDFPPDQYISGDFFSIQKKFDLVLEQTFFCAIDPTLRKDYVKHMHHILNANGKIYGVLFNMEKEHGPPYGGNPEIYQTLFEEYFDILKMEMTDKSIPPRMGNELVIEFVKK